MVLLFCYSAYATEWSNIPIYPDAKNINEYSLSKIGAKQILFEVEAKYPSNEVLPFYLKSLSPEWKACNGNNKWESFGDASGKSPLFVHQSVQHWANYKNNRLLMLAVKYESEGIAFRRVPTTNIQRVFVVEYVQPKLNQALSALGLEC